MILVLRCSAAAQSESDHQAGLVRREARYEIMRKRVVLGWEAAAWMKWIAASRSMA
jgi:hypothetical protein